MLHPPIKDYKQKSYPEGNITQWFGENPQIYAAWGLKAHSGIDIVAPHGTDILSVEDSIVVDVKLNPDGYGKYVRCLSKRKVGDTYREWTYGHLSRISVLRGEELKAGEKIGEMGNTGFVISGSTPFWKYNPYAGTHLHLGLREVVPDEAGWRYYSGSPRVSVLNYDNGYKGSINPAPYFTNTTTKEQKMLTIISLMNTVVSLLQRLKNQQ